MPMLAESWPPCRVIDRAQHPLTTAIPDTEGSTKLFMLYFQEVAGRILCQITGGTDKTYSGAWGYLYLLAEPLPSLLSYLQKQTQKPLHLKKEKAPFAQYNTTQQFSVTLAR